MAEKESLREQHAHATRERILVEATALFIQHGFNATTVDEIAERAEVSPRTFFRYFATKEALLFHDFEDRVASIREGIVQRPTEEDPARSLVAVLVAMIADLDQSPQQRALMVRLIAERPALMAYQRSVLSDTAEPLIAAALAERAGRPSDDLGLRAMVAAVTACFDLALRAWIEQDARPPFEPIFLQVLDGCFRSFPHFDVAAAPLA